jgi:hypothetical protein
LAAASALLITAAWRAATKPEETKCYKTERFQFTIEKENNKTPTLLANNRIKMSLFLPNSPKTPRL